MPARALAARGDGCAGRESELRVQAQARAVRGMGSDGCAGRESDLRVQAQDRAARGTPVLMHAPWWVPAWQASGTRRLREPTCHLARRTPAADVRRTPTLGKPLAHALANAHIQGSRASSGLFSALVGTSELLNYCGRAS